MQSMAARNNADWCERVCRTHGLTTTFADDAWTSGSRTPPFYPDAVTLVPSVSAAALLSRLDVSPGCSVKDSYASLDLSAQGFGVLFDAEWIARTPTTATPSASTGRWEVVSDPQQFAMWERAWRGDDGAPDVLRVELLRHAFVKLLAEVSDGRVVAGAVLNRTGSVVGISNFFAQAGNGEESWAGCLALADTLFPDATLVGYERSERLEIVHATGFRSVGALRVWSNAAP